MNRRHFITTTALAGLTLPSLAEWLEQKELLENAKNRTAEPEKDESYWAMVRNMFEPDPSFTNLENGYFSPQPVSTRNFFGQRTAYINRHTSRYMRTEQDEGREKVRTALAKMAGSGVDETAIVRNTTEAMNVIIMGYPWKAGDEAIYSDQDYGSMVEQLQQASARFGIVLKKIALPIHPKSDEEIVGAYMSAAGPRTKLLLLTHLINLSGQILPSKAIIEAAHQRKIEVLVDAAHSFAHVSSDFNDMGADYLGCSLHKWLCNPLGAGMLCIKKEHIEKIWPLFGDTTWDKGNIRKFEHYGTHPNAVFESIIRAISFHELMGADLKTLRLRYLQRTWTDALRPNETFYFNTPVEPHRSCALANVGMHQWKPAEISQALMKQHKIFTVAIDHPVIKGIRVTPHLYTSIEEINTFTALLPTLKK
jgi:selenocysteine lyase/cysteine desulfurase